MALLLDDADGLLRAELGQLVTGRLARDPLVLTEVPERAGLLPGFDTAVQRDHRDAAVGRLLHVRLHRVRLRQGDGDAVDLRVDRGLHQVGLVGALRRAGVLQFDVVLLRGRLGALADQVPEGVTRRRVRDERDLHPRGVGDVARRRRRSSALLLLAAGGTAGAQRRDQHERRPRRRRLLLPPNHDYNQPFRRSADHAAVLRGTRECTLCWPSDRYATPVGSQIGQRPLRDRQRDVGWAGVHVLLDDREQVRRRARPARPAPVAARESRSAARTSRRA